MVGLGTRPGSPALLRSYGCERTHIPDAPISQLQGLVRLDLAVLAQKVGQRTLRSLEHLQASKPILRRPFQIQSDMRMLLSIQLGAGVRTDLAPWVGTI